MAMDEAALRAAGVRSNARAFRRPRRLEADPHEMSCGVTLSCGPKVLLADEPTTALDSWRAARQT